MPHIILPKLGLRRKDAADRSKIGARYSRGRVVSQPSPRF